MIFMDETGCIIYCCWQLPLVFIHLRYRNSILLLCYRLKQLDMIMNCRYERKPYFIRMRPMVRSAVIWRGVRECLRNMPWPVRIIIWIFIWSWKITIYKIRCFIYYLIFMKDMLPPSRILKYRNLLGGIFTAVFRVQSIGIGIW